MKSSDSVNTSSIHIRRVEPFDLDQIIDIEERSFTDPWTRMELAYFCRNAQSEFLVAIKDTTLVGYIIGEIVSPLGSPAFPLPTQGHLLNLAVYPSFRRRGIGTLLLKSLIQNLLGKGVKDLWLEVRASNQIARHFYLMRGFQEKDRQLGYYPDDDAINMTKVLTEKN
jgi:ribosomal-protein-alanine N-acetyltransferase